MGGKVWGDMEEEIFWTVVARLAPPGFHKESKAAKKKSHHDIAKSWAPLIDVMKSHMLEKNPAMQEDDLPRRYSAISIYEHWFQNLVQGKFSPHAGRHVREHQAWLKSVAEKPESASESLPRTISKKQKHRAEQAQQKEVMQQHLPIQQQQLPTQQQYHIHHQQYPIYQQQQPAYQMPQQQNPWCRRGLYQEHCNRMGLVPSKDGYLAYLEDEVSRQNQQSQ